MDADGSHRITDLVKLLNAKAKIDLVIGIPLFDYVLCQDTTMGNPN